MGSEITVIFTCKKSPTPSLKSSKISSKHLFFIVSNFQTSAAVECHKMYSFEIKSWDNRLFSL